MRIPPSVRLIIVGKGDELGQARLEQLLLLGGERADRVNLGHTLGAELDVARKVLDALGLVQRGLDERGLDDALLAVERADERVDEDGAGCGGGAGRAASAGRQVNR